MAKVTVCKMPGDRGHAPDPKDWVAHAPYVREQLEDRLDRIRRETLGVQPNDPFMEKRPAMSMEYIINLNTEPKHNVRTVKDLPVFEPPIIWPFLISSYFRLRLPLKRTYPIGFVPTTVFTGKYRDDIVSVYPYEMQASFKHQLNPIITHWLSYIASIQYTDRAHYRDASQAIDKYLNPK